MSQLFLCAVAFGASQAYGAGPLGPNGAAIGTSDYAIDLYQGPVFAGTRVTGLAGAYVAIAEEIDGSLQNPAAPAVRPFYSVDDFDYYPAIGFTFPASVTNVDFFNSGAKTALFNSPENFVFVTPALNLQWGRFGVGITLELQNYGFQDQGSQMEPDSQLGAVIAMTHLQLANAFFGGQLTAGVGVRVVSLSIDTLSGASENGVSISQESGGFATTGTGIELGLLWRPNERPYRVGAAFRSGIQTQASFSENLLPDADGDILLNAGARLYLPDRLTVPWDLNVGVAVQLGQRPFNPTWRSRESASERAWLEYRLDRLNRDEIFAKRLLQARGESERDRVREDEQRAESAALKELERARETASRRLQSAWQRYERFYLLFSASLLASGGVDNAVGVESFLTQKVNRSGRQLVWSPRFGAETELLPDLLKVRLGTYVEPTRFATSEARAHATAGLDVRLGRWDVLGLWPEDYAWRLGVAVDNAQRYFSWAVSIGGWFPRAEKAADAISP